MEQVVALSCHEFFEEGITTKMLPDAKVFRFGQVVVNLHRQIAELETKLTPNTPPEVLEVRQNAVTKNAQKI